MTVEMTPLARGRHRLSRAEVAESQRDRLMRALAEVMAEKGYVHTSVADVLRRARVSRESFYQLFSSKEACFMSAFEEAYAQIGEAIASGVGADRRLTLDGFERVLDGYLTALASDPVTARVFLIEVYAVGPEALQRRHELQRELIATIADLLGASSEDDRFAVEVVLAATVAMVTARLAVGDVDGLRSLQGPIVAIVRRLGLDQSID